eukprot:scaffold29000_cov58-Phaeocystis_antarctica.AAC.2
MPLSPGVATKPRRRRPRAPYAAGPRSGTGRQAPPRDPSGPGAGSGTGLRGQSLRWRSEPCSPQPSSPGQGLREDGGVAFAGWVAPFKVTTQP